MALVLFGLPELGVGAVEPVQDPEDPEALVEPGAREEEKILTVCGGFHDLRTSIVLIWKPWRWTHGFVDSWTHLRWWKSWNSGEGRKGRWYPQWEMLVLTRARQYQRAVVVTWEPRTTGPITTGSMLEIFGEHKHPVKSLNQRAHVVVVVVVTVTSPRAPEDERRCTPVRWEPSTRGAACGSVCRGWGGGRA